MSQRDYDELLNQMTRRDTIHQDKPKSQSGRKSRSGEAGNGTRGESRSAQDAEDNTTGTTGTTGTTDTGNEGKFASTIDREGIDYYAIMGIDEDADTKTIKRAYNRRIRKYHPDNVKDKSDAEAVRKNKEKYKLINEAYNVLKDEFRRKAYNTGKKYETTRAKSFKDAKTDFGEFIKLQEQNMTDEDKKLAQLKFEMSKKELNTKHGYDESKEEAIDKEEYTRRVEDLALQRGGEQDDMEIDQDNMFEGRNFNPNEFNKKFEKEKRRQERRTGSGAQGGLVVAGNDGVMAFNDGADSAYAPIDSYSDLYADGKYTGTSDNFAGVGDGLIGGDNSGSDDISIDSADIQDTYDTHAQGNSKEAMDAAYQKALSERSIQDDKFDAMGVNDFGSAMDDKFGISKDFGFMVGDDKFGHQIGRRGKSRRDRDKKAEYDAYKELTEN